jgi:hypothetical protein
MDILHDDVLRHLVVLVDVHSIASLSLVSKRFHRVCISDIVWHCKLQRRLQRDVECEQPKRLFLRSLSAGIPRVWYRGSHLELPNRRDVVRLAACNDAIVVITLEADCFLYQQGRETYIGRGEDALVGNSDDLIVIALLHEKVLDVYVVENEPFRTLSVSNVQSLVAMHCSNTGVIGQGFYLGVAMRAIYYIDCDAVGSLLVWNDEDGEDSALEKDVAHGYLSYPHPHVPCIQWLRNDGSVGNCHREGLISKHVKKYCRVGPHRGFFLVDSKEPQLEKEAIFLTREVEMCWCTVSCEILVLTVDKRLHCVAKDRATTTLARHVLWVRDTYTSDYVCWIEEP